MYTVITNSHQLRCQNLVIVSRVTIKVCMESAWGSGCVLAPWLKTVFLENKRVYSNYYLYPDQAGKSWEAAHFRNLSLLQFEVIIYLKKKDYGTQILTMQNLSHESSIFASDLAELPICQIITKDWLKLNRVWLKCTVTTFGKICLPSWYACRDRPNWLSQIAIDMLCSWHLAWAVEVKCSFLANEVGIQTKSALGVEKRFSRRGHRVRKLVRHLGFFVFHNWFQTQAQKQEPCPNATRPALHLSLKVPSQRLLTLCYSYLLDTGKHCW